MVEIEGSYLCPVCADWPVSFDIEELADTTLSDAIQRILLLICFSVCDQPQSISLGADSWRINPAVSREELYLVARCLCGDLICDTQIPEHAIAEAITALKEAGLVSEETAAEVPASSSAPAVRSIFTLTLTGLNAVRSSILPSLAGKEKKCLERLRQYKSILLSSNPYTRMPLELLEDHSSSRRRSPSILTEAVAIASSRERVKKGG
jgi:hypothetical protein